MSQELIEGFRLSPQQKRLWSLQPDSSAYRAQCAIRIEGDLRVDVLEAALRELAVRHQILRTSFEFLPGMKTPVQVVTDASGPDLRCEDLSEVSPDGQDVSIKALFAREGKHARFCLVRLSSDEHVLLVSLPALCADACSLKNLFNEIGRLYQSGSQNVEPPDEAIQYAQFSEWQYELLEAEENIKGRDYWHGRETFSASSITLPGEASPTANVAFSPATHTLKLGSEVVARLTSIAAQHATSLEVLLLVCWQTLLWRLAKQPDITLNLMCDGRVYEEMNDALGVYEKSIPVSCHFEEDYRFAEMFSRVGSMVQETREWQEYFAYPDTNGDATPAEAWPVSFDFQQWPAARQCGDVRFSMSEQYVYTERCKLRLSCMLAETSLELRLHYDQTFYEAVMIESVAEHLGALLQNVTEDADTKITALDLFSPRQRHQLLVEWNDTSRELDQAGCLHRLFEEQVRRSPEQIAVMFEDRQLSYQELNRRANQVARRLRRLGVGPETRVALCMRRSVEMIVGLFGILKAGGAYVPLDAAQPKSRLAFMLEDSQVSVILTEQAVVQQAPLTLEAQILCLDTEWEDIAREESTDNLDVELAPGNLAYMIYTSGSTGRPKGTMITHSSVVNLATALVEAVYQPGDIQRRVSLSAPLSFDSSVKQLVQLLRGATLCIVPEEVRRDGREMLRYLTEKEVEVLDCTPSQLRVLLDEGLDKSTALKIVLVGGEAIDEPTWKRLASQCEVSYYNLYGPTECTVDASVSQVRESALRPTIGRPVANTQIYILDEQLQIVPVGLAGELYIGGAGLARGYHAQAEMTAEKFIPNPFSLEPGRRLYKTGDMARHLPDGEIEYIGRSDEQVKVRGSRIELGEIEAILAQHPAVRNCVVAAREDIPGDVRLVAYVVAANQMNAGELRGFLQERLPDYMMPGVFVPLETLPLTRNGKIDRRSLPAPEQVLREEDTYVAARSVTEEVLTSIWGHLLGVERLSSNSNFFEMGGHSLLATQAVSHMRKALKVEIALRSLFEEPTVAGMARHIESLTRTGQMWSPLPIECISRDRHLPLSFAQQRLWFIQQLEPDSYAYNIARAFRINGPLNLATLEQTLSEIVRRHEVLRTTFVAVGGQPVQIVAPAQPLSIPVIDLTPLSPGEREAAVKALTIDEERRSFDLAIGPLLRTTLIRLEENDYVALFTMHHIIFDAWSIGVLIREVGTLYESFSQGLSSPLPELPIQYADFAQWQREMLQGEKLDTHLSYWKQQLADTEVMGLPTDRPRPPIQTYRGSSQSVLLPNTLAATLKALSRREGVTLYMTLLASFITLLHRYTGQTDIVVGTPIANRNQSEIEDLIGFFINTLALRVDASGDLSFRELLSRVREVALGGYTHQDLPFEYLVEQLQPERNMSRPPIFQVMFALLQNAPLKSLQLPGITLSALPVATTTSKFDLLLLMEETEDGLKAAFEYNTDLFDAATIGRMLSHFQTLLESVGANAEQNLSSLPLMTDAEREKVLIEWNDTESDYPHDRSVRQLFEAQVDATPDAIAAVFEDQQLTYQQLNNRANQLAHFLSSLAVGPEVLVGISLQRSMEIPIAVLGVLKAGGAYVPLDSAYPKDRLAFMMKDAGVKVLLTESRLLDKLPEHEARVVCLDEVLDQVARESKQNLDCMTLADNVAYVTYTSGSTGIPKGIVMTQRPLLNLLEWQRRNTLLPASARTLQFASLSFDVSFQDMFSTWTTGGTVVLISEAVRRDIVDLAPNLAGEKIQRLFIPAVALQQLAEGFSTAGQTKLQLQKVIAGSEQLQITQAVARMFREMPECTLHNEYGPSETHVVTSLDMPAQRDEWDERPAIGRPIANTQIYLLDTNMQPAPPGVQGELYVGGVSLARGYLNRPEVTAEKFIPDPFSSVPGRRLYRTGDVARHRPNGEIEFVGRIDHQVKVRGYRIELGEIETVLAEHSAVSECIAMVREDVPGDKRLVCYVVREADVEVTAHQLHSHLLAKLPEYMQPSAFVMMPALPLTPNGKVDRKSLPVPELSREDLTEVYTAPHTALERAMTEIWSEVLGVERIGIKDNFFELGGHSLLIAQLVSRVYETFHVKLPIRYVFEAPTILGLVEKMIDDEERPGDLEKTALLLEELAHLSEEEAQAMLYSERLATEELTADFHEQHGSV